MTAGWNTSGNNLVTTLSTTGRKVKLFCAQGETIVESNTEPTTHWRLSRKKCRRYKVYLLIQEISKGDAGYHCRSCDRLTLNMEINRIIRKPSTTSIKVLRKY